MALGANLPGPAGSPRQTLIAVRPQLEQLLVAWAGGSPRCSWSPLLETAAVGGPADQPPYLNAVVLLQDIRRVAQEESALELLDQLQHLEHRFGRDRGSEQRWGPRPLDLDLLFWDELRCEHPRLVLPHPRLHLRTFVLKPLLAAMEQSQPWHSHSG